jgi:NADH-quinone oxidoreductase subunit C
MMMTRDEIKENIIKRFQSEMLKVVDRSPNRLYIDVPASSVRTIAEYVFKTLKGRFNTTSALDARDHMEVIYHFTFDEAGMLVVSFRTKLEKTHLEIDSLVPIFQGANWIEREIHELLGINFKGHPDLRRLLLPEDWPEGVYPLRRDYKEWDPNAVRDRGV